MLCPDLQYTIAIYRPPRKLYAKRNYIWEGYCGDPKEQKLLGGIFFYQKINYARMSNCPYSLMISNTKFLNNDYMLSKLGV